jgi:hypothetical protein
MQYMQIDISESVAHATSTRTPCEIHGLQDTGQVLASLPPTSDHVLRIWPLDSSPPFSIYSQTYEFGAFSSYPEGPKHINTTTVHNCVDMRV